MAQAYKPGEIVPQSGIYTITHDPAHADMSHEVTVIKGRRFPTCRMQGHPLRARPCGQACRRDRSSRGGACAGFVTPARHGAAVSAQAQRRGRSAGMDSTAAYATGRGGAGRVQLASRNQVRRLPHACAPRPRGGAKLRARV